MTKAVSNIDTEFFEDVTALTLWIDEAIQSLAATLDRPDQLTQLAGIHRHNRQIRAKVFTHRDKIKRGRITGPLNTNHNPIGEKGHDSIILPVIAS